MTALILILGLLAGMDNLQVCAAIGLLPLRWSRRHLLATAFICCEIVAPIVGLGVGRVLFSMTGGAAAKIGPWVLLFCGGLVLLFAIREHDVSRIVNGRAMLIGLPISLSLDNLFAGLGVSPNGGSMLWAVVWIGLISATMSCAGLYVGGWTRRFLPVRMQVAAGVCVCVLAIRMLLAGRT